LATTYTDSLRLSLQGTGDNANTWGSILNTVLGLVDEAVAGNSAISLTTGSNITLTTLNGSTDEARKMSLTLSGTPSANISLIVPAIPKLYVVEMQISGSNNVTLKTSSGTGVTLLPFASKSTHFFYCNGTNVYEVSVPQGTISMWHSSIATIPSGYLLCDGTNNTPDLRDQFIVGAKEDNSGLAKTLFTGALTQAGGSYSTLTGASGAHDHGALTGGTAITIAQMPAHTHTVSYTNNISSNGVEQNAIVGGSVTGTSSTGGGGSHNHSITAASTHSHSSPLLPYYALAFIMRV